MNIICIYSLCIYIYVGVEALPRIFINGIYKKTNKLDKYVNNNDNVEGIRILEVLKQDECTKFESREECLRRLKRAPTTYVRRLSKYPFALETHNNGESSEDNKNSIYVYDSFSRDYSDAHNLHLRSGSDSVSEHPIIKHKPRITQIFKVIRPNKYNRFTVDLTKFRRNNRKKKVYDSVDSDSSSSSELRETIQRNKKGKNKRFPILEKSLESDSESSEEIRTKKKNNNMKSKGKVMYMQSPSRLYEGRRRLQHFLPKRYEWDEDDLRQLSNYWFSGPQGKYWGTQDI